MRIEQQNKWKTFGYTKNRLLCWKITIYYTKKSANERGNRSHEPYVSFLWSGDINSSYGLIYKPSKIVYSSLCTPRLIQLKLSSPIERRIVGICRNTKLKPNHIEGKTFGPWWNIYIATNRTLYSKIWVSWREFLLSIWFLK